MQPEIPDELPRIPNFDQEAIYVVRHGDKKELVAEIVEQRRAVEGHMTSCNYAEALLSYQKLCIKLEQHVRKPHDYFLQARAGISHCIWNLYCRQQKVIEDEQSGEDVTGRDKARNIYKSSFDEKVEDKGALELGEETEMELQSTSAEDTEKKMLLDNVKASLNSSSQLLSKLKEEQEASRTSKNNISHENPEQDNMKSGPCEPVERNKDINQSIKHEVGPTAEKVQECDKEMDRINKEIKERKKREWEQKEQRRLAEQEEKRKKKEKDLEDKLQRKKEEDKLKKEQKVKEEELKRKLKEEVFLRKQEEEKKKNELLRIERETKKKQEEDELEKLLMALETDQDETELENDSERQDLKTEILDAENEINVGPDFSIENDSFTQNEFPMEQFKMLTNDPEQKLSKEEQDNHLENKLGVLIGSRQQDENTIEEEGLRADVQPVSSANKLNLDEYEQDRQLVNDIGNQFIVSKQDFSLVPHNKEDTGESNVWSALRKLRESAVSIQDLSALNKPSVEVMTSHDLENLIKSISEKIAEKKNRKEISEIKECCLNTITEESEQESNNEILQDKICISGNEVQPVSTSDTNSLAPTIPFDYENWNTEVNKLFKYSEDDEQAIFEKERFYMEDLKKKIDEKIKKEILNVQRNEVKKLQVKDNVPIPKTSKSSSANADEFLILKMKEKDRKRKKKEEKFKDTEEKIKDMAQKTLKIERISVDTEKELKQMKERSRAMVLKSRLKEQEFQDIFKSIEEEEKENRKSKRKGDSMLKFNDDPHWTEEESNKWPAQAANLGVSNALSMMKVAAQGKTGFSETFRDTINTCKTLSSKKSANSGLQKCTNLPLGTEHLTPHSSVDLLGAEPPKKINYKQHSQSISQEVREINKIKSSDLNTSMHQKEKVENDSELLLDNTHNIHVSGRENTVSETKEEVNVTNLTAKAAISVIEILETKETNVSQVTSVHQKEKSTTEKSSKQSNLKYESPDGRKVNITQKVIYPTKEVAIEKEKNNTGNGRLNSPKITEVQDGKVLKNYVVEGQKSLVQPPSPSKHKTANTNISSNVDHSVAGQPKPSEDVSHNTEEILNTKGAKLSKKSELSKHTVVSKVKDELLIEKPANNKQLVMKNKEEILVHSPQLKSNMNEMPLLKEISIVQDNKRPITPIQIELSPKNKVGQNGEIVEEKLSSKNTSIEKSKSDSIKNKETTPNSASSTTVTNEKISQSTPCNNKAAAVINLQTEKIVTQTVKNNSFKESNTHSTALKNYSDHSSTEGSAKPGKHPVIIHTVTPTSFLPKQDEKSMGKLSSPSAAKKSLPYRVQCFNIESLPIEVASVNISNPKALTNGNEKEAKKQNESVVEQRQQANNNTVCETKIMEVKRPPPPKFKPPPPPIIF